MALKSGRFAYIGDSSEWFWLFGLLALGPLFLSEAGFLTTLATLLSDPAPATAMYLSDAPTVAVSMIPAVSHGSISPVDDWLYVTLALTFALAGQCRAYVRFAPLLTLLILFACVGVHVTRGVPVWYYLPALLLGFFAWRQWKTPQPTDLDWRHHARALLAVAAGWMLVTNTLPLLGLLALGVATFGMAICRRIDTRTIVGLVIMCLAATLIGGDDSAPAVARYVLFGLAATYVIVQFGRTGRLISPSAAIVACVVLLVWLTRFIPSDAQPGTFEPIGDPIHNLQWLPRHLFALGQVNWLEVLGLLVALVLARWAGLIRWHNRKTIAALRASRTPASLFRDAFWASLGVLSVATVCWILAFVAMRAYDAALVKATTEQLTSPTQACPAAVAYTWSPEATSMLALSRVEIERTRLETHRCLDFKIREAIATGGDTVATVQAAAKTAFSSMWPPEIVKVPSCPSFFFNFPITCYIERAVKQKINEKYREARDRAIERFNARTDALAEQVNLQTDASGTYLKQAIEANVDHDALQTDRAVLRSHLAWAFFSFIGTCYLLLLALKLYLSVAARYVHEASGPFATPLSVRTFRKGAVYQRLKPNAKLNYDFDATSWNLSTKLSLSGVAYATPKLPYRPWFAPLQRLGSWYWTRRVISANNAEILSAAPVTFVHVLLGKHAGVVFQPRDLVGFRGAVDFRAEWNYRLLALVFMRHRFYSARGPGELLLQLPGTATTDTTLGTVTMVRILNAHENVQVEAAKTAWNVAFTPESVTFPVSSAWLAREEWFRTKIRQARAFLLPF
jgi:hypothetical protein